jgi:small-conductance mechanosensitive channel/CRP-like cAMP-binding protein
VNLWTELLRPGLFGLVWALAVLVPLVALYRWSVLRGRLGRFTPSVRLGAIVLVTALFLRQGGSPALAGLERLLGLDFMIATTGRGLLVTAADSVLSLMGAFLAARLADTLVFESWFRRRRRREIPRLLRDSLRLIIIALVAAYVLVVQWGFNATLLGGGAAVVTLVLGLALQNVLGDLFSGVILQFERPFHMGDWVKIGDHEGRVIEINWRATRLNTRENVGVVIPNSVVAKTYLSNLSLNEPYSAVDRYVGVEYREPPNRVKGAVLEAVLQSPDVLRQPPPRVWTHEYGESAVIYHIRFWIRDFSRTPEICDGVMTNIWYVFKRYGITIPWPIRNVYLRSEEVPTQAEQTDQVADLLRQVDLFTPLSGQQLRSLADGLVPKSYGRGEALIRQGEEGDSFFIILSGRVQVLLLPEGGGAETPVAVLGPRDFFGEMSLLAGDRHNATVRALEDTLVIIIDREAFARIIRENPAVAAEMASIYYRRTEELSETRRQAAAHRDAAGNGEESGEKALLRRIQRFFGL